jgi:hypothetical protein
MLSEPQGANQSLPVANPSVGARPAGSRSRQSPSRYRKLTIHREDGRSIAVYATPRLGEALDEIIGRLSLYEGVRLSQVIEAAYDQGRKDGARLAFAAVHDGITQAKNVVPHRSPGRPRKPHG